MADEIIDNNSIIENKELNLYPDVAEVLTKLREGEDEYVSAVNAQLALLVALNRGASKEEVEHIYNQSFEEELNRRKSSRAIGISTTITGGVTGGTLTKDSENGTTFEVPQHFTFYGQAFGRISEKLGISVVEGSARNNEEDNFGGRTEMETWSGKTDNGKLLSLNVQHQTARDGQNLRWVRSFSIRNSGVEAVPE